MTITEIRRRRRSLELLVLDGAEGPLIDRRTLEESPYRTGSVLTEEELETLKKRSEYNRAHDRALYLLGLRDYSCRELAKKLMPEASETVAETVVARLADVGLLNDESYALRLAASLAQYKQYPRRRIEQELQQRGIDRETARRAAEETDCDDFQQALALVRKKYYNKVNDREAQQKTIAALARRGFSFEAARRAVMTVADGIDAEETDDLWQ